MNAARRDPKLVASCSFLAALALVAVVGPWLSARLFGTASGLAQWLAGAHRSLVAAALAASLSVALGCALSGLAVLGPPIFDAFLARALQLTLALPSLVLVLALRTATPLRGIAAFGAAVAFVRGVATASVLRACLRGLAREEYVLSARALGSGRLRLFRVHLFPPLVELVISQASFTAAALVALDAATAFLGLDGTGSSFGAILANAASAGSAGAAFPAILGVFAMVLPVQAVGLHFGARATVGRRFL